MANSFGRLLLSATVACTVGLVLVSLSQTAAPGAAPGAAAGTAKPNIAWDWTFVIGTGQSLSVGARAQQPVSTAQPYNNMKLSTGALPWPIDPNSEALKLEPLVEPIGRKQPSYPNAWPTNISGAETPHTAMANAITALVKANFNRDFISIHGAFGEDGQGYKYIKKNPDKDPRNINGHAYEGSLVEIKAISRLAKEQKKTFGVGAIIVTHGESDNGSATYDQMLHQMWTDYNADIPPITGQTQKVLLIVSQQNAYNRSNSALAMWRATDEYPGEIVCSGPKYQYPAFTDALHMTAVGYQLLGEKYGEVYYERVILGKDWRPLEPTKVSREGKVITVQFHVPNAPLVWETEFDNPHDTVPEWKNGKGFEVITGAGNGTKVAIESVAIKGDSVVITCAGDPGEGARVGYAQTGEQRINLKKPYAGFGRWGLLKDSDTFKGDGSKKVQPNYALAFELPVP